MTEELSLEQVDSRNESLIKRANSLAHTLEEVQSVEQTYGYVDADEEEEEFSESLQADTGYGYAQENSEFVALELKKARQNVDAFYAEHKDELHELKEDAEK